jgi:hypothetical protein
LGTETDAAKGVIRSSLDATEGVSAFIDQAPATVVGR